MSIKPIAYLLCGLPGSGKTTYAKQLEKNNVVRLTLDEELFKLFGREFPADQYQEFERQTKEDLLRRLVLFLKEGKSVALDWGFWKKSERNKVRGLVHDQGSEVKMLYFKKDLSELINGVADRDLSKNHEIGSEMLEGFAAQFEEPINEGEQII